MGLMTGERQRDTQVCRIVLIELVTLQQTSAIHRLRLTTYQLFSFQNTKTGRLTKKKKKKEMDLKTLRTTIIAVKIQD